MANRVPAVGEARRAIRRRLGTLTEDLREARLAAGLSQLEIARALGLSDSQIGRFERGEQGSVAIEDVAVFAAAVGLKLSINLYPIGGRLRDARQLQMIERYRQLTVEGGWRIGLEVPVGGPGDLRAFDLVLTRGLVVVAHEFVSRLRDVQAQIRPLMLKQRDAAVERLVLVVAASHGNRRAVVEAGTVLRGQFPVGTKATLAAIRAGRDPGANGLVFV